MPRAPAPEEEPSAEGRPGPSAARVDEIPADLFVGDAPAAPGSSAPDPDPSGSSRTQPAPTVLEAHPGRWSAKTGRRLLEPPVNRAFRRFGWDELEADEAEAGGEVLAAFLNKAWADLDPSNPTHALMLWVVVVVGPRALPGLGAAVGRRFGIGTDPSKNGRHGPPTPEEAALAEAEEAGLGPWGRM